VEDKHEACFGVDGLGFLEVERPVVSVDEDRVAGEGGLGFGGGGREKEKKYEGSDEAVCHSSVVLYIIIVTPWDEEAVTK
jgi:hypothetical protein